jgi:Calx-beta domain
MSIAAASLVEGNAGTRSLRFNVSLSAPAATTVQAHYEAVPRTATAPDFKASSGTVTIAAGSTAALVSIKVKPDLDLEPNEKFSVVLSDAVGVSIDRPTATGTILNDD